VIRCGLLSRRLAAEVNATSFVASEMVGTCPPERRAGGRRQGFQPMASRFQKAAADILQSLLEKEKKPRLGLL